MPPYQPTLPSTSFLSRIAGGGEFYEPDGDVCLPLALLLVWHTLPWQACVQAVLLMLLATVWLARLFVRRIAGYTGDCLGTVQQLSEVGCYLGLLAQWR